jgi:hypothetical protein
LIELESGRARLVYAPERGGRLVSLTVAGLDLLITPALESVELLDWKGFERAAEIGYRDACRRLEAGALEQLAKVYAPGTLS